jgi:rhamnosyltransferase subunit B
MRALLTAVGSAGDVNPFIAVGRELCRRGHEITLLVNPFFKHAATAAGLELLPLGREADLQKLIRDNVRFMLRPGSAHRYLWQKLVLPSTSLLIETLEALIHAEPPDVVAYHPASFGARCVCERYKIPSAMTALSPLAWISCKDGSVHARAFVQESPPDWLLRLQLQLARPLFRRTIDPALNAIRRRHGYPSGRDLFFDQLLGADVNLALWSPVFRGPMPDDPPNGRICGFTWFDRGRQLERGHADDELDRFLNDGEPPIVFTMGTTVFAVAGDFYAHAAEACRRLRRRGLLLTGSDENTPRRLPPGVRAFPYAPFSTVLPRACATVHHGGIGTTAQALRSGKPTVVIPCAYDQFDNAARVKRLGVSRTLRRTGVSPATLVRALRCVLDDPRVSERARRIRNRLAGEDGAATAANVLERAGRRRT